MLLVSYPIKTPQTWFFRCTQTPFCVDESEAAPWQDPWEGQAVYTITIVSFDQRASSWRKVNKPEQVERSDSSAQPPTQNQHRLFILVNKY